MKAERPVLKVGDSWVRKQDDAAVVTSTVKEINEQGYELAVRQAGDDSDREYHLIKDLNIVKITWEGTTLDNFGQNYLILQWPLEVGRTWSGGYSTARVSNVKFTVKVVAVESWAIDQLTLTMLGPRCP